MIKLIDVSHWQGNIDFAKVKNAGYSGVIIKAGGSDKGCYADSMFNTNYNNAKANGLYVGCYYYVGPKCLSKEDGEADAKRFVEIIKGKTFELPVYMDVEAQAAAQKDAVTNSIIGFCEYMESQGYFVGVYASDISGFKDRINYNDIRDKYSLWVARYGKKPTYATTYDVWQYSSTGSVSGISGNVDLDECYKDFPSIIKNGGFNGYSKGSGQQSTNSGQQSDTQTTNSATQITYIVKKGDTLSEIAAKYGTNYQKLAEINGIADPDKIYAGQVIKINGSSTSITYTVQKGDTLTAIAKKYGTTINKIANDNNIADPDKIYTGQKLVIK